MHKQKPLVSVIIPTYNRVTPLVRSINSVREQTFQNFEIIVVDDASSDNTEEVVKGLGDSRIVFLKHETNRGGSTARNTGIKAARADLVAFQDSDDEWLPDKLEKQLNMLADAHSFVGVIYTGLWRLNNGKKEYIPGSTVKTKQGDIHQELLKGNFVGTPAVLVKRECFQKVGMFDETLPRFQDWDLFIRISRFYEFSYVPEPLVISYFTAGSISSKPMAMIKALDIILNKNIDDYKMNKQLYANKLLIMSNLYRNEGDIRNSRNYLIKSLKVNHRFGLILPIVATYFGTSFLDYYWKTINRIQRIQE